MSNHHHRPLGVSRWIKLTLLPWNLLIQPQQKPIMKRWSQTKMSGCGLLFGNLNELNEEEIITGWLGSFLMTSLHLLQLLQFECRSAHGVALSLLRYIDHNLGKWRFSHTKSFRKICLTCSTEIWCSLPCRYVHFISVSSLRSLKHVKQADCILGCWKCEASDRNLV